MTTRIALLRWLTSALMILLVGAAGYSLWVRYQVEPVTRDGKVRADTVPIAPDVAGLVSEVHVVDNQPVKRGDVLFVIDRPRYRLALEQAQANLIAEQVALAQAEREDRRNRAMPDVVPAETIEQGATRVESLHTALRQATSAVNLARLNLDRTAVRAPVDGTVTNVSMQPGQWLAAGSPGLALVYGHSLRIEGYFEETKLPAIRVGDPASVYLMGVADEITGHVDSIAGGVEDRERSGNAAQLANVNPSFTWVRLAQRIPVRVAIDHLPPGVQILPGQTATVIVHPRKDGRVTHRSFPW
ncbi:secretion protein HlyD family protein [Novosphingobium nitrogenifigens DSM 19370]|uniref:Secretion protein HlyD family protein n=1 Tax=Novosphingobium nitrogenifigens DSM 19370 TaxID=983920 RepID=F1ZBL3_9SPHN|nr:efflux RND transporter periplasmic adaptor subunit [Novosphingobium nitrogenifigens]EGD57903.1 secretion protein HlyD family protein [Novosphingobium nitrogenifigens DSM 19370]